MPAFPLSRISQSCPRMWSDVRLFDVGQADGFDQLRNPDQSRAHIRRQLGQFGVNWLVQRLDGPRHRSSIYQMWY